MTGTERAEGFADRLLAAMSRALAEHGVRATLRIDPVGHGAIPESVISLRPAVATAAPCDIYVDDDWGSLPRS